MSFQWNVALGYKNVFDDYENVDIVELLKSVPTKNALEIIAYFLAQLHTNERDLSLQLDFLRLWLARLPTSIHKRINDFILNISKQNANCNFINNISALILIEKLLQNSNELDFVDDLTPTQELNLFKAYLWCSQLWIDKQYNGFNIEVQTEEGLARVLIPTQLAFNEILEFKDFRLQFIKAIYFFNFCERDPQFKEYLSLFLGEYKLTSWRKYLMNLVMLYVRKFEHLKTPSAIYVDEIHKEALNLLQELCITPEAFQPKGDFLSIREKPVYQNRKNTFLFLNLNFFIDKIYQGIQFDFAKVLVKKSATFNGRAIKSTADFMSIFGSEFSETGLFVEVMNYVFEKSNYVRFSGSAIKKAIGNGEPDYYIRDKSKVYLFEFKNIFLNGEIKNSNNYEQIKSEVFKKFVSDHQSPKGITQLVNSIEKIRAGKFNKFDNYDFSKTNIYPIIVFTDFSFNIPGMNFILNQKFRTLLNDRCISQQEIIKDLVLIDLDTFIKFQDLFRNKSLKLNNLLNEYSSTIKNTRDIFKRISTFRMYIHNKTDKMDYDSPQMLLDQGLKIFSESQTS